MLRRTFEVSCRGFFGGLIGLGTLVGALPAGAQGRLGQLYEPQLYDAVEFEALTSTTTDGALAEVVPFSTDMVDADRVDADGRGVYVAVLDTGLVPEWQFFFSQADIAWELGKGFSHELTWNAALGELEVGPLDEGRGFITGLASAHGTAVTSPVTGFNVNDTFWVRGVAPRATIIPVLVMDAWRVDTPDGLLEIAGATEAMLAGGINYIADLALELDGPVIINLSLGAPELDGTVTAALERAIANGVIVVAAAGNDGEAGLLYPAAFPSVISAGAAGWASLFAHEFFDDVPEKWNTPDAAGNRSQFYLENFSARPNKALGQKTTDLDVSAPGAWVLAPFKNDFADDLNYYFLSGTSAASPHVAGLAALVLQRSPGLRQAQVEALLRKAATGCPLPARGAQVLFPYSEPPNYLATWRGGDYGKGLLTAVGLFGAMR